MTAEAAAEALHAVYGDELRQSLLGTRTPDGEPAADGGADRAGAHR